MSLESALLSVTQVAQQSPSGQSRAHRPSIVRQAGALCLRKRRGEDVVEVLLVRSLRDGSWGIPKGHIEPGETSRDTMLREAFEEAGAAGEATGEVVGSFTYWKEGSPILYNVAVHVLNVKEMAERFPEKQIRRLQWVPVAAASREVARRGLANILLDLNWSLSIT